jgi:hypothetical protein
MTNNQTIDGVLVSRELLENCASYMEGSASGKVQLWVRKLRALLDAPAPRAEFKKIEMAHIVNALDDVRGKPVLTSLQCHDLARALNDRLLSPLQLLSLPAEYASAAKPQGEHTAVSFLERMLKGSGDDRLAAWQGEMAMLLEHVGAQSQIERQHIKGMIEAAGSEYAIMIDPENGHFGWTFKRHPDGQWVSSRKATESEMYSARQYAKTTGRDV